MRWPAPTSSRTRAASRNDRAAGDGRGALCRAARPGLAGAAVLDAAPLRRPLRRGAPVPAAGRRRRPRRLRGVGAREGGRRQALAGGPLPAFGRRDCGRRRGLRHRADLRARAAGRGAGRGRAPPEARRAAGLARARRRAARRQGASERLSMDYVALFNGLGKRVKPHTYREISALDGRLTDNGLDSLDVVLLCVYACEVYAIPEAVGKSLNPATFADIVQFVEQHRTRTPDSVEAALKLV